jgi:hypothetical protein
MKIHLSGKEYVSNLEGLGLTHASMLFLDQLSAPDGVVGRHGSQWGGQIHEKKMNLNLNSNMRLNLGKI